MSVNGEYPPLWRNILEHTRRLFTKSHVVYVDLLTLHQITSRYTCCGKTVTKMHKLSIVGQGPLSGETVWSIGELLNLT